MVSQKFLVFSRGGGGMRVLLLPEGEHIDIEREV